MVEFMSSLETPVGWTSSPLIKWLRLRIGYPKFSCTSPFSHIKMHLLDFWGDLRVLITPNPNINSMFGLPWGHHSLFQSRSRPHFGFFFWTSAHLRSCDGLHVPQRPFCSTNLGGRLTCRKNLHQCFNWSNYLHKWGFNMFQGQTLLSSTSKRWFLIASSKIPGFPGHKVQ